MQKTKSLLEVDVKGFRELQAGKPKWMIVRELVANALDEDISECNILFSYDGRKATIVVEDDSPEGFENLSNAYTLFATTRKRYNPKVRGRFNLGEKQIIVICDYARIITTTGGIEFDVLKETRKELRKKREKGSEVMVVVKMKKDEFEECIDYCRQIISPKRLNIIDKTRGGAVQALQYKSPYKKFITDLKTEIKEKESGEMRTVTRETEVHLHQHNGTAYIYELGIPICEIECDYSIDVQQKVPLSADRDKVDGKYLRTLYGEVLNVVHEEIKEEQASNMWVRSGFASERATTESKKDILKKRFGDKYVIDNPFDQSSRSKALSEGYTLIRTADLSKEEREALRSDSDSGSGITLAQTSSQVFGIDFSKAEKVNPDKRQQKVAQLCERIAGEFQIVGLVVEFISLPDSSMKADSNFPESTKLRFNVAMIDDSWWDAENGRIKAEMLELIIRELAHKGGWHHERGYHDELTNIASRLAIMVYENPNFIML